MSSRKTEPPVARVIDLASYPRRRLYDYFRAFDVPVTSRTVQVDISRLREHIAAHRLRFFVTLSFLLSRAANETPELRHRIEDDVLVEFDRVRPAFTVLSHDNILNFAKGDYTGCFEADYATNLERIARASRGLDQTDEPERQSQIFITNVPWFSFTSMQHPYSRHNASIPIFSIGKAQEEAGATRIPLAMQTNHALVDGYHIGCFLERFTAYCANPAEALRS